MVNKYIIQEHISGKKYFKYFKWDGSVFCRVKKKDMLNGKIKVIPFVENAFYFNDNIGLLMCINRNVKRVNLSDWRNLVDL